MKAERFLAITLLGPVGFFSASAFSHETKDLIYQRANGRCDLCGLPVDRHEAEFHHDVPQCRGGSDRVANGNCVHGEKSRTDCHEVLDRRAVDRGICSDGRPICEQPEEKFKNNKMVPDIPKPRETEKWNQKHKGKKHHR